MDKPYEMDALTNAMEELIARRDSSLPEVPRLAASRRDALKRTVAQELPLDATRRTVAARRDQALNIRELKIKQSVAARLARTVRAAAARRDLSRRCAFAGPRASAWSLVRTLLTSPGAVAGALACLVVTAALLLFSLPNSPWSEARRAEAFVPAATVTGLAGEPVAANADAPFTYRDDNPIPAAPGLFDLRATPAQLAMQRSPFFATPRGSAGATSNELHLIRLDLSVRPILAENAFGSFQ